MLDNFPITGAAAVRYWPAAGMAAAMRKPPLAGQMPAPGKPAVARPDMILPSLGPSLASGKCHRRAVRMDRPAAAELLPGCGPALTGPQQVTDQNLDRDCTNLRPGEPRPVRLSKPLAAFRVTLRVSQLPVESQFTSGPW